MKENQDVRLLAPLEHLSTLRSTWSDEIPHEVIHGFPYHRPVVHPLYFTSSK